MDVDKNVINQIYPLIISFKIQTGKPLFPFHNSDIQANILGMKITKFDMWV